MGGRRLAALVWPLASMLGKKLGRLFVSRPSSHNWSPVQFITVYTVYTNPNHNPVCQKHSCPLQEENESVNTT